MHDSRVRLLRYLSRDPRLCCISSKCLPVSFYSEKEGIIDVSTTLQDIEVQQTFTSNMRLLDKFLNTRQRADSIIFFFLLGTEITYRFLSVLESRRDDHTYLLEPTG